MKVLLGLFIFLTASMSSVPDEMIVAHQCVPEQDVSCVVERSFVCPPGYLDGCITNTTRMHECVPAIEGPACDFEMELKCPKNFEDGCLSGETSHHFCIPSKGPLCTKKVAFNCPAGFDDSCGK